MSGESSNVYGFPVVGLANDSLPEPVIDRQGDITYYGLVQPGNFGVQTFTPNWFIIKEQRIAGQLIRTYSSLSNNLAERFNQRWDSRTSIPYSR